MDSPRDKYMRDPMYRQLVDFMVKAIDHYKYSPSEMREAAIFACILYEERNIRSWVNVDADLEDALILIHDYGRGERDKEK